ncbi:MAG: phosphoribosyltransferase family protein [Candidatus Aenigmatarchaeota archaeon]
MVWIDSVKERIFTQVELPKWKEEYIDFLMEKGVLKFGEFKLKSGRRSPTFLNFGEINDGEGIGKLGEYYAEAILQYVQSDFKTIVGPSYKGIPLSVITSNALSKKGKNVSFTFDRKEEKLYGEATGISKSEAAKKIFVGYIPQDGDKVLLIDDVITTGATKIEEVEKLKSVSNVELIGLLIGGNRQEIDENGSDAVKEISEKLKTPVYSMLNLVSEAVPYLAKQGKIDAQTQRKLIAYTRAYGTEETKKWCRDIRLIERDKGIIPACDVPLDVFEKLVEATKDIDQVVAYKIGFEALQGGLDTWVKTARKHTDKPIIYDHQKAMTDIPDTGKRFAEIIKSSGADAIIGFPQSGPTTQLEWIHSAFEQDLDVIIGGEMTHPRYKASEGGYVNDDALVRMYVLGAKAGVNNFVVPGNKPDRIILYKNEIEKAVEGIKPSFFSPGLVAQGGVISEATKVAGDRWYGIVGRGIYGDVTKLGRYFNEKEMRDAAFDHVSKL